MSSANDYFVQSYQDDKAELQRSLALVGSTIPLFLKTHGWAEGGWPYRIRTSDSDAQQTQIDHSDFVPVARFGSWPNRFSRFLGDKLFGLLCADAIGLHVPKTQAFCRRVAPFSFGKSTGTAEYWIRTCPSVQQPGKFTTTFKWLDPFDLLHREDPTGNSIPSVLAQESVDSKYSGAVITMADGKPLLEGVSGQGDSFMLGEKGPANLPKQVREQVLSSYHIASSVLGPVRLEWVFDGSQAWVVQLHVGKTSTTRNVIVPGKPKQFVRFDTKRGLDDLRALLLQLAGTDTGVILVGNVGVTSHFGDLLRKSNIPSRLEPA